MDTPTEIGKLLPDLSNQEKTSTTQNSGEPSWEPAIDAYEPSLEAARGACAAITREMATEARAGRWLTLAGTQGCGKTMLARQVWDRVRRLHNPGRHSVWLGTADTGDRRPNCVWLDYAKFTARLRNGEYDLAQYLRDDFLVVLDDIGAARDTTEFVADHLFNLCNQRLGRWTIFTTNLTLNEVRDRIDPRVASRLVRDQNVVVQIKAGDYALRRVG
jgi:DNA replication protein DnaC